MAGRVSRRLLRQNLALRESISREFAPLARAQHPTYFDSMREYERRLLRAAAHNDGVILDVYGEPAPASPLEASLEWLGFDAPDSIYCGLGSLWVCARRFHVPRH
jgi:hypothetical protein